MFREEKRQAIHILLFFLAFLLKYLSRWQAALMFLLLLITALIFVPHSKRRFHFYRRFEKKYSKGGIFYFLVLFVLALIFPPYIVAVSWAILALGDGMATLLGDYFKAKELFWNKDKTYAGSLAFIIFGTLGAFVMLKWMLPGLSGSFSIALKTTLVAAVVESLPLKINDNVTVALSSAVVLYLLI